MQRSLPVTERGRAQVGMVQVQQNQSATPAAAPVPLLTTTVRIKTVAFLDSPLEHVSKEPSQ